METKIKSNKRKAQVKEENTVELRKVYVDIPKEEFEALSAFFALRGMAKAFEGAYPMYTFRNVQTAFLLEEDGTPKHRPSIALLKDMRAFYRKHKNEVKEFLS